MHPKRHYSRNWVVDDGRSGQFNDALAPVCASRSAGGRSLHEPGPNHSQPPEIGGSPRRRRRLSEAGSNAVHAVAGPRWNPLVTKLECFVSLTPLDTAAVDTLLRHSRLVRAEQMLIHDGESSSWVYVVLTGFAYRYKLLADGRRQILGYLLPGDVCDIEPRKDGLSDHNVAALSDVVVAAVPVTSWINLRAGYPNVDRGCGLALLSERSILREWLMNVGQRKALHRLSHFFCEITARLQALGLMHGDGSVDLPVNQAALADTTGLTTVHVNRSLKRLRSEGLIELRRQRLTILDRTRLAIIASFNEDYLRLKRSPAAGE